jgi:hypothetical protein
MHNESWLYKNYKRPFVESDHNGVIVAFDPTQKNAILHQQVAALQERTQFDKRVTAKADTPTTLLSIAEEAWYEGYEHLTVLTSVEKLSEVNRFLQERCGRAFESIQVLPENSPRLYEAPQPQAQQSEDTSQQVKQGSAISLFFIQANPPLTGVGALLEAGQQLLARANAPEAHYVIHNLGITNGYALTSKLRSGLIRGDNRESMPSLYGKNGIKAVSDSMKMNSRPYIALENADFATAMLQHPSLKGREVAMVVVPANMRPHINFGQLDQRRILTIGGSDVDTFSSKHKQVIDLGRRIAKDSEKKEKDDKPLTFKKEELEPADLLAVYILNACHLSISLQGEQLDKQLALSWGQLDAATKAFLEEFGNVSGVGKIVSGVKDIAKTVGSVVKKDEVSKGQQLRAHLNQLESLKFDVVRAVNHPEYKRFFSDLDLS